MNNIFAIIWVELTQKIVLFSSPLMNTFFSELFDSFKFNVNYRSITLWGNASNNQKIALNKCNVSYKLMYGYNLIFSALENGTDIYAYTTRELVLLYSNNCHTMYFKFEILLVMPLFPLFSTQNTSNVFANYNSGANQIKSNSLLRDIFESLNKIWAKVCTIFSV